MFAKKHFICNFILLSDYDVLSKFTLLLLEDSGWYKVDYTALNSLRQNSLQWGKGLGCSFLTERCTNKSVFPYLCNTNETQLVCTYDHLSKVRTCTYMYICMYVRIISMHVRKYIYKYVCVDVSAYVRMHAYNVYSIASII